MWNSIWRCCLCLFKHDTLLFSVWLELYLVLSGTGSIRCPPEVPNTVDAHINTIRTTKHTHKMSHIIKAKLSWWKHPLTCVTLLSDTRPGWSHRYFRYPVTERHCVQSHGSILTLVNKPKHCRTHHHCSYLDFFRGWIHSLNSLDTAACFKFRGSGDRETLSHINLFYIFKVWCLGVYCFTNGEAFTATLSAQSASEALLYGAVYNSSFTAEFAFRRMTSELSCTGASETRHVLGRTNIFLIVFRQLSALTTSSV